MSGRFSPYLVERWMDELMTGSIYLTVFTADPFAVSDPLTVELAASSLVRAPVALQRLSPGSAQLAHEIQFRSIPIETTLVAIGAFDAETNGNLLFRELFTDSGRPQPRYFPNGGTLVISEGTLVLSIDTTEAA